MIFIYILWFSFAPFLGAGN